MLRWGDGRVLKARGGRGSGQRVGERGGGSRARGGKARGVR